MHRKLKGDLRVRKCDEKCLCISCMKSCMIECRKCNSQNGIGVTICAEYSSEYTQLNLSDFLNEVEEIITKEK